MAAAATKTTSETTALSNTIPTLRLLGSTIHARRPVLHHIVLLVRRRLSMDNLATRTDRALLSEARLVDKATDPRKTSISTLLDLEHQMALDPTRRAVHMKGLEGLTETTAVRVTMGVVEDQVSHVVVVVASGPNQHMVGTS